MFTRAFLADAAERVIKSYLYSLITFLLASNADKIDFSVLEAGAWAAVPAGLSALLAVIGSRRGNPDSASLLPGAAMVDDQRFRWIDFPQEFEVINPDGSIAWTATFADGAWEAVEDEDGNDDEGTVA